MTQPDVIVERLTEFSEADAVGIGRLMPFLSERLNDDPMEADLLRSIIESPYHEQLVARLDRLIVGAATMNLLMGPGADRVGFLEDFVTDPTVRERGVGDKIWQCMLIWCREQDIDLEFTSNSGREKAHRFYLNHGATIKDTTVFHVNVGKKK